MPSTAKVLRRVKSIATIITRGRLNMSWKRLNYATPMAQPLPTAIALDEAEAAESTPTNIIYFPDTDGWFWDPSNDVDDCATG
jgi:hypothetical protein